MPTIPTRSEGLAIQRHLRDFANNSEVKKSGLAADRVVKRHTIDRRTREPRQAIKLAEDRESDRVTPQAGIHPCGATRPTTARRGVGRGFRTVDCPEREPQPQSFQKDDPGCYRFKMKREPVRRIVPGENAAGASLRVPYPGSAACGAKTRLHGNRLRVPAVNNKEDIAVSGPNKPSGWNGTALSENSGKELEGDPLIWQVKV